MNDTKIDIDMDIYGMKLTLRARADHEVSKHIRLLSKIDELMAELAQYDAVSMALATKSKADSFDDWMNHAG